MASRERGKVMEYTKWEALNRRVAEAKADGTVGALIEELNLFTLDGVPIRLGMRVTDYDFRDTKVSGIQSVANDGTIWFETGTGMFDAGRLWAVKP